MPTGIANRTKDGVNTRPRSAQPHTSWSLVNDKVRFRTVEFREYAVLMIKETGATMIKENPINTQDRDICCAWIR